MFDPAKIAARIKEIEDLPPFEPDKYELRFTCSQLFETGIEATLHFVLRNGEPSYYKSTQKKV